MNAAVATLFAVLFLNTIPTFGANIILEFKKSEPEPSTKEKFIHWVHNRHSPKHLGIEDPYLPSFMKFKPLVVPLPWGYELPEEFLVRKEKLDMRSLTPQVLKTLPLSDLKVLLDYLATVPVEIKWSDQEGHTQSGKKMKHRAHHLKRWDESNAAAALALTMGVQAQSELFTIMIALAPEAILPEFRGHMPGLIDAKLMAQVMGTMLTQLDQGNAGQIARTIADLTQRGLCYWVAKDISKLNPFLAEMFSETTKIIETSELQSKEAVLGLLLGSVIAGTINHVDAIKKSDEKLIWIVGVVSNLAWASTSFIGCAPVAAPIAAATAASISIATVLSTTVLTALKFPRDYAPSVKEIEGNLELAALKSTRLKGVDEQINILLMLTWMRAAIHVNGLTD